MLLLKNGEGHLEKRNQDLPIWRFSVNILHNSHDPQHMQLLNNDDVNGVDVNWPEFQDSRAKQLKQQSAGKWEHSATLLGSGNAPQLRHSRSLQHQSASFHKIAFGLCGKEQEYELYCFPHS